jgi:hypothetical protein
MLLTVAKSIFSSFGKTPKEKKKENYAKSFYGAMASKDSPSGTYKSYKSPFQQTKDDIQMDLGLKPKDADYYARLAERKKKSQDAMKKMMASTSKSSAPSKPKGPSAAEIALAKRKAEGQAARKKFEKEKGERRIALRKRYMKLLKLA